MKFTDKLSKIFSDEDFTHFQGLLVALFINAWDFLDRFDYVVLDFSPPSYLQMSRIFNYLLMYVIPIGYWGFFLIHILFCLSFIYVGRKLNVKALFIYFPLMVLPVLRFGVWDYNTAAGDSISYLIMTWIYYFGKTKQKKSYYLLSIIGFFTREFCLYVNIFFILETFFEGTTFQNLKQNWKTLISKMKPTIKAHLFEIILLILYIPYRLVFTMMDGVSPLYHGMFSPDKFEMLLDVKILFHFVMVYSYLTYYLIAKPSLPNYTLFFIVLVFSWTFGMVYEINKLGCIFIIYVYELFHDTQEYKQERSPVKTENTESLI